MAPVRGAYPCVEKEGRGCPVDSGVLQALALSSAAGLSTALGTLAVFLGRRGSDTPMAAALGFAAGVMAGVSLWDLFPEAISLLAGALGRRRGFWLLFAAFLAGIALTFAIDRLVPDRPAAGKGAPGGASGKRSLFHLGLVSMLAILLHNLPEGMATFMAGYQDAGLGLSVALAIALHNIPEGVTVAVPIYQSTGSRARAFGCALLSGLSEPVGALLAWLVLGPFLSPTLLGAVFSLVCGVMLFIAVEELIPASWGFGRYRLTLLSIGAGLAISWLGTRL